MAHAEAPPLPPGRHVPLPGRGTTFVREVPGPPGAATLLLLHGWTATADLNWFTCYEALGERFRVLALDHRGHGRGIRSRARFTLADCADDAAALVRELRAGPVVPVGYSMGGPVAQLLWRRHPELVRGLVLCATSRNFRGRPRERLGFAVFPPLAAATWAVPGGVRDAVAQRVVSARLQAGGLQAWALAEMAGNDHRMVVEAGAAIGSFSSHGWIGEVDVPTAVVITGADPVVPPHRQHKLADAVPGAHRVVVPGATHAAVAIEPERFVPALVSACTHVTQPAGTPA